MKRYIISKQLREEVQNSKYTIRELNKILGFEIRNILNKNLTIREDHLTQLSSLLKKNFKLKEVKIDYKKNLGERSFTEPIKKPVQSKFLAEFIGIMLGDGNIWNNRIRIAFDKRDTEYIKYVFNLFKRIFGIELKTEIMRDKNATYLHRTNVLVTESLLNFGLKRGDKIKNKIGIPKWIIESKNYSQKCLRGLIDTDGCVYFCKREKRIYIKFTNFNKKLLSGFRSIAKGLGYDFVKAGANNVCLYKKEQIGRFIKEIKPFKYHRGVMGQPG